MEGMLLNEIMDIMNTKLLQIVIWGVISGIVILQVKDIVNMIFNYFKLKMSDFGRGTKVKIDGYEGYIQRVRLKEVEIIIDDNTLLLIPVDRFIKLSKVIVTTSGMNK